MDEPTEMKPWYRVRCRLRCEEVPLRPQWLGFELRALFKVIWKSPLTFHAWGGGELPQFQSAGRVYDLEIFLTGAGAGDAEEFVARLRRSPFRGFLVVEVVGPDVRTLGGLLEAKPFGGWGEVCLDFHTPLIVDPAGAGAMRVGAAKLLRQLEARAKHVLGSVPGGPFAGAAVGVLPWYLRNFRPESRESRSQPGHREVVSGVRGPLFVRGNIAAIWPALVLAEEVHLGRSLALGCGRFSLGPGRPTVDRALGDCGQWLAEAARLREDPEHSEEWNGPRAPDEDAIRGIVSGIAGGKFPMEPATRISIAKTTGGTRTVGRLEPETFLFHRVLARVLARPLDLRLPEAAIAYRPGRNVSLARPFLSHAIDAGCTHVAKADIASFFDEIPWDRLREVADRFLPAGDSTMRAALEAAWTLPFRDGARQAGVLQGSPLSPMLANLFLAGWDEEMAGRGHRHIRYGDDLLVAASGEAGARLALADAENLLEKLGLRLNPEKTAVLTIADGFRHLGLDLGGEDGDIIETAKPALRRTLYLTKADEWAGLDHGAILIRDGKSLLHRLPLLQIANIVLLGIGGVSTSLVTACMHRAIPLTFADHSGHHCGTMHPEPRAFYSSVGQHALARRTMSAQAVAAVARGIVGDKLGGYLTWADSMLPPASGLLRRAADMGANSLRREPDLAATLGVEGAAARALFRAVNDLCRDPFWNSERRNPHGRRDPWNLLLDTLSFLLFTRINFLVRAAGLDPYQGFLHSPSGRFESLVCDLQEPFRARVERLAVRLANLGILKPEDALRHPDATWTWSSDGWRKVITEFETELDRRRGRSPVTWRTSLDHLVEGLRLWTREPDKRPPWHRQATP
jgi:CRISPR-associated protein Cas1